MITALLVSVALSRLRASAHRIRGADLGPKVSVGRHVEIHYPSRVHIGQRATLEDDVWLKLVSAKAQLVIGEYSFIGRGTEIDVSGSVEIGNFTLIAPRVFITDHNHNIALGKHIMNQGCSCRPVVIGNDVWIGTNVVVLPGVTIGSGAVVGAGSVVTKSLPPNTVSVGVPARPIRDRN